MSSLRIYNTLKRRVEEFIPGEPGKVKMYTCGPTVYNRAHIGNFRTFLFSDLVRRYLRYRGYEVLSVMNITDIDDRTISGSRQEGIPMREFTERYTKLFFDDCAMLGIEPADITPKATEHIAPMVDIVRNLRDKGMAYESDGSWYFNVESFPSYGELARLDKEGMRQVERVAEDDYVKHDPRDFALWKGWEPVDGEVFWETEIGKGRPGWHLECSAMSLQYLGEDFDIHLGGVDLIFPHHQNEIAQTEGATGKRLARYWMHSEFLMIDTDKMSKSLGNFYSLSDIVEKGWTPREIRFALMSAHYRQQLNFTMSLLEQARNALSRLDSCVRNQELATGGGGRPEIEAVIARREAEFVEAMDNDLNLPEATAAVFSLVRDLNKVCAEGGIGPEEREIAMAALQRLDGVLGFVVDGSDACAVCEDIDVDALVEQRNAARAGKNWAEADRIRNLLLEQGIVLEDRAGGTVWRRV